MKLKILYKKELAEKLERSAASLAYYLNKKYYNELKELGYEKTQRHITQKQYEFLKEKLVIVEWNLYFCRNN